MRVKLLIKYTFIQSTKHKKRDLIEVYIIIMKGIALLPLCMGNKKNLHDCNSDYPTKNPRGQKLSTKNPFNKNKKKIPSQTEMYTYTISN